MSICKHFTNIFKDHLKNEYDDYEIIFYKFNYDISNFRNFKIPINTDKQKIVYILFDEKELYFQHSYRPFYSFVFLHRDFFGGICCRQVQGLCGTAVLHE